MSQLDAVTYISQVWWLMIVWIVLYSVINGKGGVVWGLSEVLKTRRVVSMDTSVESTQSVGVMGVVRKVVSV